MEINTDLVQIRPAFGGNIMAQIVINESRPRFIRSAIKSWTGQKVEKPSGKVTICNVSEDMVRSRIEVLSASTGASCAPLRRKMYWWLQGAAQEKRWISYRSSELLGGSWPFLPVPWLNGYGRYRPPDWSVGRTVKPKLILTFGVSGAIQFTACMNSAECIVAVNNDPEAPIFNIADIAIKDDLYAVLPGFKRCKK